MIQIGFETRNGKPYAVNVTVKVNSRPRVFTAAREVIVTAGFYGTPALLLKSGVGAKNDLYAMEVSCSRIDLPSKCCRFHSSVAQKRLESSIDRQLIHRV